MVPISGVPIPRSRTVDNQESKALHIDSIRIVSLSKQELACWILAGWWALKWELDVGWVALIQR